MPKISSIGVFCRDLGRKWAPEQDCALCGAVSGRVLVCGACERSLRGSAPVAGVAAAFAYRFPLDRLVQRFKYGGDLAVGTWLGERLADRVASEPTPDLLAAPPLSRARLRERGFNQAHELAKRVARRHGIPVLAGGLARLRDTPSQSALARDARRANLAGAFACRTRLAGSRVAIVDDVFTTGATTEALAAALVEAGASRVDVWVVAVTPPPGD